MAYVLMTDPATGRVALFLENGTSGDPADPNATRNLPLNNPVSWLPNIKFHSDLDYLEVAFAGTTTITHSAISGIAAPGGLASAYATNAAGDDNLLLTHSLGYSPLALVAIGGDIVWPGMQVQFNSDGGGRYATAYGNATELRLATTATIGAANLVSDAITYQYLVFKRPPAASGHLLIDFDPSTGILSMGLGKFSSDRPYLQVVSGGSSLALFGGGRTIDLNNGAPKLWRADVTTFAPVPTGLTTYLINTAYGKNFASTEVQGESLKYGGSYTGPPTIIEVQAP